MRIRVGKGKNLGERRDNKKWLIDAVPDAVWGYSPSDPKSGSFCWQLRNQGAGLNSAWLITGTGFALDREVFPSSQPPQSSHAQQLNTLQGSLQNPTEQQCLLTPHSLHAQGLQPWGLLLVTGLLI